MKQKKKLDFFLLTAAYLLLWAGLVYIPPVYSVLQQTESVKWLWSLKRYNELFSMGWYKLWMQARTTDRVSIAALCLSFVYGQFAVGEGAIKKLAGCFAAACLIVLPVIVNEIMIGSWALWLTARVVSGLLFTSFCGIFAGWVIRNAAHK